MFETTLVGYVYLLLQIGVNAGHCDLYYSLCISMSSETKNLMNLRPCDGDYGMVGFRIDMVDRDQCTSILFIVLLNIYSSAEALW